MADAATGPMTVKAGMLEVDEAVNAVEATLVTPAEDPLLATVRRSVAAVGPGQEKDALVSSARAAASSVSKRATLRGIARSTMVGVEVAPWIVNDAMNTAEAVVEVEAAETATTTDATAHPLAAALPVRTIAEAVPATEEVMKWAGVWVRPQGGTTRDRHPANKMIVTSEVEAASEQPDEHDGPPDPSLQHTLRITSRQQFPLVGASTPANQIIANQSK